MRRSNEPYERIPADEDTSTPQENLRTTDTNDPSQDRAIAPNSSTSPPAAESGPNTITASATNDATEPHQQNNTDPPSEEHTDTEPDLDEGLSMITADITLTQLVVEREYHRRGSSACSVILSLVLFRLWVEAIFEADVTLMIISSFMTTYLVAWRRHRAAIENELTEQIEEAQRRDSEEEAGIEIGNGNGEEETSAQRRRRRRGRRDMMMGMNEFDGLHFMTRGGNDHIDLEMLGFQAQLAFAIMESQRHIMETGGYGRPDGGDENQTHGVSDETKASWKAFKYDVNDATVRECADLKPHKNEDPSCCICLCEYEEGEMLNQLCCGHVYHKDCIDSWCQNHIRCPLCNLNLEEDEGTGCDSIV